MNSRIPAESRKHWRTYEEVARHVLHQLRDKLGLEAVEGKQNVDGKSGTVWELDGKGVRSESGKSVVIECRRYTNRVKQDAVAAVAYKITDTGSEGGIIVSPHPLQRGGQIIAAAENIEHVELTADSTTADWLATIEGILHAGATIRDSVVLRESFSAEVRDKDGNLVARLSKIEDQ